MCIINMNNAFQFFYIFYSSTVYVMTQGFPLKNWPYIYFVEADQLRILLNTFYIVMSYYVWEIGFYSVANSTDVRECLSPFKKLTRQYLQGTTNKKLHNFESRSKCFLKIAICYIFGRMLNIMILNVYGFTKVVQCMKMMLFWCWPSLMGHPKYKMPAHYKWTRRVNVSLLRELREGSRVVF